VAFATFKGLLWRLKFAANYFNSKDINPLFINEYLDPTRTTSKECGFAYTLQFYKNHQAKAAWDSKIEPKTDKTKARKAKMKAIVLVEKKIRATKNGKTTIPQLFDYVNNNAHIPHEIKLKLPDYIKRIYTNN
jgi:hypothetical protein